jgi:hypothetical protein
MANKKDSSNAKKTTNSVKRHAKLVAPKGEKVSSMKTVDVSTPKQLQLVPVGHH